MRWALGRLMSGVNGKKVTKLGGGELAFLGAPHRFLLAKDEPAKEATFKRLHKASGKETVFAFQSLLHLPHFPLFPPYPSIEVDPLWATGRASCGAASSSPPTPPSWFT